MTTATAPSAGIPAWSRRIGTDVSAAKGHAAGTLFVAPDGDILLLRRAADGDYAGHWALPGGNCNDGEEPEAGARREAKEEISFDADTRCRALDQRMTPNGLAFHTFASPVGDKFTPRLNGEHTGYAWASMDQLPRPLHPGVEATLRERVGINDDMAPEDWAGLRQGFLKWLDEEAAEPEHGDAEIKNQDIKFSGAQDQALALDRDSVREFDQDGRLRVKSAHISKANVCPYFGREIPDFEKMGLDPERKYMLLRHPDELRKAAPTFNGLQILRKHIPVNAEDHQPYDVVGATGTDSDFSAPYLDNSLTIWAKDAIDAIESGEQKELSCGYHYRADMTPGIFNGMRFDGVMRDIVGNHVALVRDGRAGPDVVVGDSGEEIMSDKLIKALAARQTTIGALVSYLRPRLAMDASINLAAILSGIPGNKFRTSTSTIATRIRSAAQGKLAKDASLEDVEKVLHMLGEHEVGDAEVPQEQQAAMQNAAEAIPEPAPPKPVNKDAEPLRNFLKEKGLGEDDINTALGMVPPTTGADADPELDPDEEKLAKAKDADPKEKDKDMVSKPAMDAAIQAAVEATRKAVITEVRDQERGIRTALNDVRPFVGELNDIAFDSGEQVYRHALGILGVAEAKTIDKSALKTILSLQRRPGATPPERTVAMDSATADRFAKRFPGASRISIG